MVLFARSTFIGLIAALAAGCTMTTLQIDPNEVAGFKEGTATKAQIHARYGEPGIGGHGTLQGKGGDMLECDMYVGKDAAQAKFCYDGSGTLAEKTFTPSPMPTAQH